MTHQGPGVYAGVDTHHATHHAAVIDHLGRQLGDREFPATSAGYRALAAFITSFGPPAAAGIEGTGSYGAGLARHLTRSGVTVLEVNRPERAARRRTGKSDPLDAYAAARAAAAGTTSGQPKSRDGIIEAIRTLRVARSGAVKARTQTINQIKALITTAPQALREHLQGLSLTPLITTLTRLRPGTDLADPATATKTALRALAHRHRDLTKEITDLDKHIGPLVARAAPTLLAIYGVGPETAAQLLQTAGDNPDRMRSEAAFAHLCGTAPIPASSGKTRKHRLNRAGDRQANKALYTIVLTRLGHDQRTRDYAERRTTEGLTKKEIIRCLKRYVAREVYHALTTT